MPFLLEAASRLQSAEPRLARQTYLEALRAAIIGGRFAEDLLRHAAEAARNARASVGAPRAADLLLDGLAVRFTDGYAAAAPQLKRALSSFLEEYDDGRQDVRWPGIARRVAVDLLDDETWHAFGTRTVQLGRDRGALGVLPLALNYLALFHTFAGDFDTARALFDESDAIADATGAVRIVFGRFSLAAFRGDETAVSQLIGAGEAVASTRGEGVVLTFGDHARALLYNGLGPLSRTRRLRPAEPLRAHGEELGARRWARCPELVEAAARMR